MQLQQIFGRPPEDRCEREASRVEHERERAVQMQRKILRKLHKKPVAVAVAIPLPY